MRPSNTWYALILIALALLLNVVSSGSVASEPSPRQTEPKSKETQLYRQNASDQPTPAASPPPIQQLSHPTPNGRDSSEYAADQERHGADWVFNLFIVIFTGGLVAVGAVQSCLLYYTYKLQRIALRGNRPYLMLVSKPGMLQMNGILTGEEIVWATNVRLQSASVEMVNAGNSPAVIDKVVGHLRLQTDEHDFPTPHNFTYCVELPYSGEIVQSQKTITFASVSDGGFEIKRRQFRRFWDGSDVIFYGCVYYSDAFGNEYQTEFCVNLHPVRRIGPNPPRPIDEKGTIWFDTLNVPIVPKANNRRT